MFRQSAILIFTSLFLLGFQGFCQTFTISGVVKDSSSAETLPWASLQLEGTRFNAQANAYGQFSMRVPKGNYTLTASFVGYKAQSVSLHISENKRLLLQMVAMVTKLQEVEVKGVSVVSDATPGRSRVSMEQILKQPAFAGEADVLKSIQFLPGVKSPSEATTNISVRGGSYDQTLILLDGAPVYNPSHALGFFSTFNADAIKDVELYKGLLPARYGNRLSSVVDIRMRDGNVHQMETKLSVGLIASRITIEGPVKKGISSFIVSARYSYAGSTVNALGNLAQLLHVYAANNFSKGNTVKFHDLNGKINFTDKSGRNRFFFSAYNGNDRFNYYLLQGATVMGWGNQTASLQWHRLISNRLFMVSSATYSRYGYHYQVLNDSRRFDWNADQKELNLKAEFDYSVSPAYSINFGGHISRNNNQPGRIDPLDSYAVIKPFRLQTKHSGISAVFLENLLNAGEFFKLSIGFRQSVFSLLGPATEYHYTDQAQETVSDSAVYGKMKTVKNYFGFEPRLGATWLLSEKRSVKVSWNQTIQYSHLLSNSSIGLPTDIWIPSNRTIKPQLARQVSLGYYQTTSNNRYDFTVEGYYKQMTGVIDFIDNADLFVNKNVETQIRTGQGLAYGIESQITKQSGKFRYQVSYTWSKTARTIQGINHDRPYPTRDDRRHALSLTSLYAFTKKRLECSVNFVINSGAPITMPSNTFYYQGALFYIYNGRNQYRLPVYHRLDISVILRNKPKNYREGSWILSVYNVYDRKNVFTAISQTQDYASFQLYKIAGLSAFGVVPSVTYTLNFK